MKPTEKQVRAKIVVILDKLRTYKTRDRAAKIEDGDEVGCEYFLGDRCCIVGAFLPKEWRPDIESWGGGDWTSLVEAFPSTLKLPAFEGIPEDIMMDIQDVHDSKTYWRPRAGLNKLGLKKLEKILAAYDTGEYDNQD